MDSVAQTMHPEMLFLKVAEENPYLLLTLLHKIPLDGNTDGGTQFLLRFCHFSLTQLLEKIHFVKIILRIQFLKYSKGKLISTKYQIIRIYKFEKVIRFMK